jgi:hypothetical protein
MLPVMVTPGLPNTDVPPVRPPIESVERFEVAFAAPHALQQEIEAARVEVPSTPSTLGERILATFDNMHNAHLAMMARTQATLTTPPEVRMTSVDLMNVFFDVTRLMLQQEVLSKAVGKTTQNLDTLLKGQ